MNLCCSAIGYSHKFPYFIIDVVFMQHSEMMIDRMPALHLLYSLKAQVIVIALFKSKNYMDKHTAWVIYAIRCRPCRMLIMVCAYGFRQGRRLQFSNKVIEKQL